jgi:putative IMPACT (imprinted ancient) family translation regulator
MFIFLNHKKELNATDKAKNLLQSAKKKYPSENNFCIATMLAIAKRTFASVIQPHSLFFSKRGDGWSLM